MWYTSGMKFSIFHFCGIDKKFPAKLYFSVISILIFITFLLQNVHLSRTGCFSTRIVVNKVGHAVVLIMIPSFWIPHISNTMHVYIFFTFLILVYIPNIIFTLKPHSSLLKNSNSSCSVHTDTIVYNATWQ